MPQYGLSDYQRRGLDHCLTVTFHHAVSGSALQPTALSIRPKRANYRIISVPTQAEVAEWQTRRSQTPLGETPCRFDSDLRHQPRRSARGTPPTGGESGRTALALPGGAAVAQGTLNPLTQVRILAGQPLMPHRTRRFAITARQQDGRPRALVTGGAGFIGSHLARRLVDSGWHVTTLDNLSSPASAAREVPGARARQVDISDLALADIFAEDVPDIVFHLAAQVSVPRSMRDPEHDALTNVVGGINVLQNSARAGVQRIVLFSTGGALYGEPEYLPCDESHPIKPSSIYGASKHALEEYTRIIAQESGIAYTILRPGNVYGPGQDPHGEAGVVAIFAARMLAGEDVTIYGNGAQERDYVYVGDVVNLAMAAARPESPQAAIYNVSSGIPTSVNAIFAALSHETGYGRPPIHAPERPGDVTRIYLDSCKARDELGWSPQIELQDGIGRTVAALREGH